ncbi:MAG TPA: diguanylate cyclase, partial [Gammaproteobacteria bacterium]|nr:diguanylate cyclase [Gammaproteobacteria bacterium]
MDKKPAPSPEPKQPNRILLGVPTVVFQTDAQGNWHFLNPAWERLTGYGTVESLEHTFPDFLHPEDKQPVLDAFRSLLEEGEAAFRMDARCLTREEGFRWVEIHAARLPEKGEKPEAIAGTLRDVAARKAAEAGLRWERDQAMTTLDAIGDGVITTDAFGRIDFLNPAACRLTGWSPERAKGRLLGEVFRIRGENGEADSPAPLSTSTAGAETGKAGHSSAWLRCADGSLMAVEWTSSPTTQVEEGRFGNVLVFRDVTLQRTLQEQMAYQATHDPLTGLVNRNALQEALIREDARARRENGAYTILLLDLDRFKVINDYHGHSVGDVVLSRVAERILEHVRKGDWFGRWGGEEFLCILPNTGMETAHAVAERIRSDLEAMVLDVGTLHLDITASIGLASYPGCAEDSEGLLAAADSRLYEAKRTGRNRVVDSRRGDPGLLSMAGKLQRALATGGITAAYQPIVSLSDEGVVAEEALARLFPEPGECLPAGMFIEAASHLQLVHRIDEQLIRETMSRCAGMVDTGQRMAHFVNISTELLRHRDRVEALLSAAFQICETCGLIAGEEKPLVIEITEREFLEDPADARRVLAPFIDYGFRIAVDDFGSGYSSFKYLADLPVSFLKIEGDLVSRVTTEPRIQAIVRGIRDIAGELGLITIAEKVEDRA